MYRSLCLDLSVIPTWLCFLQAAEQDRNLTQTNMKIDTEVAGLKTMLESHKLDTIKYLAGRSWLFVQSQNYSGEDHAVHLSAYFPYSNLIKQELIDVTC